MDRKLASTPSDSSVPFHLRKRLPISLSTRKPLNQKGSASSASATSSSLSPQLLLSLSDSFRHFYAFELPFLTHFLTRSKSIGCLLILLKELILLQFLFHPGTTYNGSSLLSNSNLSRSFTSAVCFLESLRTSYSSACMYAFLMFHSILITSVFATFVFSGKSSEHSQKIPRILLAYCSGFILSYEYLFAYPSLLFSISEISNPFAVVNALLTVSIGLVICSVDYRIDYMDTEECNTSVKSTGGKDLLSRYDSGFNMYSFLIRCAIVMTYNFASSNLHLIIVVVASIILVIGVIRNHSLMKPAVHEFELTSNILRCIGAIVLLLTDASLLHLFVILPLPIYFSHILHQRCNQHILLTITSNDEDSNVFFNKEDSIIDSLLDYILSDESRNLEVFARQISVDPCFLFSSNLKNRHDLELMLVQQRAEEKQKNSGDFMKTITIQQEFGREDILMDQIIRVSDLENKYYIGGYLSDLFEKRLRKIKTIEERFRSLGFSFMIHLLQVQKNLWGVNVELARFSGSEIVKAAGLKPMQKMAMLQELAIPAKKVKRALNLSSILEFEDSMACIRRRLFSSARSLRSCYEGLSLNLVDLNQTYEQLSYFRRSRQELRRDILLNMHSGSQSQFLREICYLYDEYFQPHSTPLLVQLERIQRSSNSTWIHEMNQFYNQHSCLAKISLLQADFGKISLISRNFNKVFRIPVESEVIGKDFTAYLPESIAPNLSFQKQNELSKFNIGLQRISEYLPKSSSIKEIEDLIAKSFDGYAFQIKIKAQIDAEISNHFGIVVWIGPMDYDEDSIIIVLDAKQQNNMNNRIDCVSYNFREFLFDGFLPSQHLSSIRLHNFLPAINELIQKQPDFEGDFTTVLVKPISLAEASLDTCTLDSRYFRNIKNRQLYKAVLTLRKVKNELQEYSYLILKSVKEVKQAKKSMLIGKLKRQIEDIQQQFIEDDFINQMEQSYLDVNARMKNTLLKTAVEMRNTLKQQKMSKFYDKSDAGSAVGEEDSYIYSQSPGYRAPGLYPLQLNLVSIDTVLEKQKQINNFNEPNSNSSRNELKDPADIETSIIFANRSLEEIASPKAKSYRGGSLLALSPEAKSQPQRRFSQLSPLQFNFMKPSLVAQEPNYFASPSNNLNNLQQNAFKNDNKSDNSSEKNHIQPFIPPKLQYRSSATIDERSEHAKEGKRTAAEVQSSFDDEEEEENKKQVRNTSTIASTFHVSQEEKKLVGKIQKQVELTQLKVINFLGLISITVVLCLTVSGFYTLFNRLLLQKRNFKYINWLYLMNIHVSQSYSEYNIKLQQDNGLFMINGTDLNKNFTIFISSLLESRLVLSADLFRAEFNSTDSDIAIFEALDSLKLEQNFYANANSAPFKIQTSMLYSLETQYVGLYHFIRDFDYYNMYRYQGEKNYPYINTQLRQVVDEGNAQYKTQLDDITNQAKIQLIVVLIVSLLFFASVLPVEMFMKNSHRKILDLFTTLDVKFLREILTSLSGLISLSETKGNNNNGMTATTSISLMHAKRIKMAASISAAKSANTQMNQLIVIQKKINLANSMPIKFKMNRLIASLALLFVSVMVYPSVNYILTSKFIENSMHLYEFNNAFCEAYFLLINCLRARQGLAVSMLLPNKSSQLPQVYRNLFQELIPKITEVRENFKSVMSKQQTLGSIHNQQQIDDFIIAIMEKNACDVMAAHPEYQNGDFDYTLCTTAGKGVVTRGFYEAIQFFYQVFIDNSLFAQETNVDEYRKSYNTFNKAINGYNQLKFKAELTKLMDYSLHFFQDQNLSLYDYYESLSLLLFSVQMAFLLIGYIIGWSFYYGNLKAEAYKVKLLLDILPQSVLMTNNYMKSYLNSIR